MLLIVISCPNMLCMMQNPPESLGEDILKERVMIILEGIVTYLLDHGRRGKLEIVWATIFGSVQHDLAATDESNEGKAAFCHL